MSLSIAGAATGGQPVAPPGATGEFGTAQPDAKRSPFGRATDPYRDVLDFIDLRARNQATGKTLSDVVGSLAKRPGASIMPNVRLVSSGDVTTDRATLLRLQAFFEQDPSLARGVQAAAHQAPVYVVVGSKATDGPDNYKPVNFQSVNADGKRLAQVVAVPGAAVRKLDYAPMDNEFFEVALRSELGNLGDLGEASRQSATAVVSDLSALKKEGGLPYPPDVMALLEYVQTRYDSRLPDYQKHYEGFQSPSTPAYRQAVADALNERLNELVDQSGYKGFTVGFEVSRDGAIEPALITRGTSGSGQSGP